MNLTAIWWILLPFLIFSGLTIWGVFEVRLSYFTPIISAGKGKERHIALTFDDGPTVFTPQVLTLLEQYNCKATFFCIGQQLEQFPLIAQEIVQRGHIIANHTYTHTQKMGFLSADEVVHEIQQTNELIQEITGVKSRLFRPPFGVTNPAIAKAAKRVNHQFIGWNIRSFDTAIADHGTIVNRIVKRLKPGGIVLMHDTSEKSVQALEQLLLKLNEKKYKVVSLSELLRIEEYEK